MKKHLLILILTICTFANEKLPESKVTFSMGSSLYWYSYSEQFTDDLFKALYPEGTPNIIGTPKSDEYGPTLSICGAIESTGPFFFSLGGEFAFSGNHTYDGSAQDTSENSLVYIPLKIENKKNRFGKFEIKSGYKISTSEQRSIIPFIGLRLQRWGRALGFSYKYNSLGNIEIVSTYDIKEIYHWTQLLFGCRYKQQLSKTTTLTLEGSFDLMTSGSMEYTMSTAAASTFDSATEVTLSNHPGLSFSFAIQKKYSKRFATEIAPFYRFHHLGLSNLGTQSFNSGQEKLSFLEPESKTHSFGIVLQAYLFSFSK